MKTAYRLNDLSETQLEHQKFLIEAIINNFPYIEPPKAIIRVRELLQHFPIMSCAEQWSTIIDNFNRFLKHSLVSDVEYRKLPNGVISFEADETRIKKYLELILHELANRRGLDKSFCRLENTNFFLTLNNGSEETISFITARGSRIALNIFTVLYEEWLKSEVNISGWIIGELTKDTVKERIKQRWNQTLSSNQIKDGIHSIMKDRVRPKNLENYVGVGIKREISKCYLKIRRP